MSFLNFFSKAVTGYKNKSRILSGHKVSYKYSGKSVLFDPFTMMKELQFRFRDAAVLDCSVSLEEKFLTEELREPENYLPNVIFTCQLPEGEFRVKRFVQNPGNKPLSCYDFFFEGKFLAKFRRLYDYGAAFDKFCGMPEIFDQLQQKGPLQGFRMTCPHGTEVYMENFSHSQTWLIYDLEGLKRVQSQL